MKQQTHRIRSITLSLALLFIMAAHVFPETQVSISASDNNVYIGDRINLKILVKTNTEVREIKVNTGESAFEILQQQDTEKRPQKEYMVFEKNMSIAFFKVGDFNIGPFTIELTKDGTPVETHQTNSIPVTVKSALKEEDKDIKPLKGLIDIKGDPFYILKYVLLALGIVLLAVFIIWWFEKRKKVVEVPSKPPLSPLEELEFSINELWSKRLFEKDKMKLHFIELTRILKHFLSRNYGYNAEDFTTYETIYHLKAIEKESSISSGMRFLFETSDLVKFAKFIPDDPVMAEVLNKIKHTVEVYRNKAQ